MRCSCLFIILGAGWRPRGHGGGRGPGSPRPSLPRPAAPLSPRMGGRCSSLPGPAALSLRLALSSPAGDSAPGPQVTPLSQVCFLALFASSGPLGLLVPRQSRRVWVRRPAGDSQVVCAAPPPLSAPPSPGGGKQVSPFQPPRLPSLASWVPAPPTGLRGQGINNLSTLLKETQCSMLRSQMPRTGPSRLPKRMLSCHSFPQRTPWPPGAKGQPPRPCWKMIGWPLWRPGAPGCRVPWDKSLELWPHCL